MRSLPLYLSQRLLNLLREMWLDPALKTVSTCGLYFNICDNGIHRQFLSWAHFAARRTSQTRYIGYTASVMSVRLSITLVYCEHNNKLLIMSLLLYFHTQHDGKIRTFGQSLTAEALNTSEVWMINSKFLTESETIQGMNIIMITTLKH